MKRLDSFLIATIIPTLVIWVWIIFSMTCIMDEPTGVKRCYVNVSAPLGLNVPLITFILYAIFYGLSVLASGYKITKK